MEKCVKCDVNQLGGLTNGLCNNCQPALAQLISTAANAVETIPADQLESKKFCCKRQEIYYECQEDCPTYQDLPECERCGQKIQDASSTYKLPGQDMEREVHPGCIPRVAYVNAHAVSRHFGGSEEGGWWYNAGEPLASVPVAMTADPKEIIETLKSLLEPLYQEGNIYSMRGGTEVQISVEDHMAEYWPATRPRYE